MNSAASKEKSTQNYQLFEFAVLAGAILLFGALLSEYAAIAFWQHDSIYYDPAAPEKIKYEGRWLIPWIAPILANLDGSLVLIANVLMIFVFYYLVARRFNANARYAIIFAGLAAQFLPFAFQLMWPVNTAPSIILLLLAIMLVDRLNMLLFYCLFGILFFATGSYYYYLLPVLHLSMLYQSSDVLEVAWQTAKIIICWAFGFIVGYGVLLLVVYFYSYYADGVGQWGLDIRPWRQPRPAHDLNGLIENGLRAVAYFQDHIAYLAGHVVTLIALLVAIGIRSLNQLKAPSFNPSFIALLVVLATMAAAHYVITLPVGIRIDVRSMAALWTAVFAAVFFVRGTRQGSLTSLILSLSMLVTTAVYYQENKNNLRQYDSIAKRYYADFEEAMPADISAYKGVAMLTGNIGFAKTNSKLLSPQGGYTGKIPWLNTDTRWTPNAYEYGFGEVKLCGEYQRHTEFCNKLWKLIQNGELQNQSNNESPTFHQIYGTYQQHLVVYLKPTNLY